MYINVVMQNIPNERFYKIFNIPPSYLWIIYEYFASSFILGNFIFSNSTKVRKEIRCWRGSLSSVNSIIFDLYDVVRNFAINLVHNLMAPLNFTSLASIVIFVGRIRIA